MDNAFQSPHGYLSRQSLAIFIRGVAMSILSIALRLDRRPQPRPSQKTLSLHAKFPLWIQVVTVAFVSLTVLTYSTLTAATLSPVPPIFALPQEYLPGNSLPPLPKDVECSIEYVYVACPIPYLDKEVYLSFQQGTRMIISASIRVHEYSIGELIATWGTPTAMTHYDSLINVYWGNRSALLYTSSFRSDNRVTFIVYHFDSRQASPWRGFTGSKR
jgi:hypothetical protein